ncbi:MAG: hypothetical protein WC998_01390 [Candidatus Paceibacterota bacterium]|jgi:hypothetical protein
MNDSELIESIKNDFISNMGIGLSDENVMQIIKTGRDLETISGGKIGIDSFVISLKKIISSPNIVFYSEPVKVK